MAHETADYVLDDWDKQRKTINAICNTQRWKGQDFSSWTKIIPRWVQHQKLDLISDLVNNNLYRLEYWNPKRYAVEGAKEA